MQGIFMESDKSGLTEVVAKKKWAMRLEVEVRFWLPTFSRW